MLEDRICKYCNNEFKQIEGKIFANHVKWCEKNPNSPKNKKVVCNVCKKEFSAMLFKLHNCTQEQCLQCNNLFIKDGSKNKFCSKSCAAKYFNNKRTNDPNWKSPIKGHRYESIDRICCNCNKTFIMPKNVNTNASKMCKECNKLKNSITTKCIICNTEILYLKWDPIPKTCCNMCYKKLLSINSKNNPNCGGETIWIIFRINNNPNCFSTTIWIIFRIN